MVEAAFKWTDIKPANGAKIGLEFQINDAKGGKRIGTLSWYDETGMGWSGSNVYGTVELTGKTGSNGGGSSVKSGNFGYEAGCENRTENRMRPLRQSRTNQPLRHPKWKLQFPAVRRLRHR